MLFSDHPGSSGRIDEKDRKRNRPARRPPGTGKFKRSEHQHQQRQGEKQPTKRFGEAKLVRICA